mmetsp:Transcript_18213/g.37997  ORF Transcript_18213/g.37997 Transcript_18213/m.37997 type:complete len:85 (-) Transcript_18213:94-348(-)
MRFEPRCPSALNMFLHKSECLDMKKVENTKLKPEQHNALFGFMDYRDVSEKKKNNVASRAGRSSNPVQSAHPLTYNFRWCSPTT